MDPSLTALEDILAPRDRAGRLPRAAKITMGAVIVLSLAVLPFCRRDLGAGPGFLAVIVSTVLLVDIVTAYLLTARFRDRGDARLLVMALAYVWSSVIVVGYALSFPGLVGARSPLGSWPSASPWLYVAWQVGFPLLLGVAWGYPASAGTTVDGASRRRVAWLILGGCIAVGVATVAFVAALGSRVLPVLIVGNDTTRMAVNVRRPVAVLTVLSALVVTSRIRGRGGPERWAMVTAWVCVDDLLLTYVSVRRFSVGWYAGRSLTVLCASLVFLAMLGELTALQRRLVAAHSRLHFQARTDDLTRLANRLVLRESLDERLSTGARTGAVMLLDLDRLKVVNDSLGHEAGDDVIVETARRLTAICPTDLVVRLGGDEFAVVLAPGTSRVEARRCALALIEAMARPYELVVDGRRERMDLGVSIGLTTLEGQNSGSQVLREADLALYRAKEAGRGCFVAFDPSMEGRGLGRSDDADARIA